MLATSLGTRSWSYLIRSDWLCQRGSCAPEIIPSRWVLTTSCSTRPTRPASAGKVPMVPGWPIVSSNAYSAFWHPVSNLSGPAAHLYHKPHSALYPNPQSLIPIPSAKSPPPPVDTTARPTAPLRAKAQSQRLYCRWTFGRIPESHVVVCTCWRCRG